ncbi:acyltransferase [Marinithermus hydrothermalis]|uniref:Acetyltransferase n=1 Tax=Marinithermus hydrothermalis (strain DSM 14884 / JCM 11576 / T1) TaxID=869210 RepID=F2NNT5_MARHT|nr:acyltransferase [Marinithermus hydrothermalis]AEB11309.1 putative acetyltransferase [Marinithermus hydrothermalis DSM 14884]
MPWLLPKSITPEADEWLERWLGELTERLADPATDRNALVAEILSEVLYARPYEELKETAPLAALALDPRNVTFEAEYYAATDPEKFARVKPLLWLWKTLDLTPLGQSIHSGVRIRRALAPFIFKRVGKNPKFFQNVEFSVGYNLELGDDVVVHRHVLLDDIGGIVIGDGASISDYANIYSHTHHVLASPDVTLKQTIIGNGVRITYHATVLAGVRIGDDAMVGTGAVVTRDVPPHAIALGIPARPRRYKVRHDCPYCRAEAPHPSDEVPKLPDRKPNPDYPDFLPPGFGTREA